MKLGLLGDRLHNEIIAHITIADSLHKDSKEGKREKFGGPKYLVSQTDMYGLTLN